MNKSVKYYIIIIILTLYLLVPCAYYCNKVIYYIFRRYALKRFEQEVKNIDEKKNSDVMASTLIKNIELYSHATYLRKVQSSRALIL